MALVSRSNVTVHALQLFGKTSKRARLWAQFHSHRLYTINKYIRI